MMKSSEIRSRFLKFFEKRGHTVIPSASLVPSNYPIPDNGSLFTTAGMQPLIPYLMGIKHPNGTKLVDVQKCVRTSDIDDVGDNRHLTFFEMLGNWSLGDYFKKESINWSYEFLTSKDEGLGLDPDRLYVTTFKGEDGIPRDEESIIIWQEVFRKNGITNEIADESEMINGGIRIIPLGKDDNFWIAGQTGPCGGDTEIFYDVVGGKLEGKFSDLVKSGRIIEIWNNVFMEFNKTVDGKYIPLSQKNVDTGMGLERTAVVMQGKENVFETDIFSDLILKIKKHEQRDDEKARRIVVDHIRSAVFMIADEVIPSNIERGYVLRRIIRRCVRYIDVLGLDKSFLAVLTNDIINQFSSHWSCLKEKEKLIIEVIETEDNKFRLTLKNGLKQFEKIGTENISGHDAFILFSTYGFPFELTRELAKERQITIDEGGFHAEMKKHQEISRAGAEQKFKGGLGG
ncbi:MAG: alanine--tRNA ligase-related protein, partial [Candidatus Paceibacterota bacterium]